ncbi:MAG: hypothetical protein EXR78_02795 [Deltaproteobacteria bacterium]|nr:hypothetical protein [Deltaproteobacteria bacterium]
MDTVSDTLATRFLDLLAGQGIFLRGSRGRVKCPFHNGKTDTSLSIDTDKGIFYCFGCGVQGGVKAFAELVGEPWGTSRLKTRERARFSAQAHRREAEAKARAILTRRKDERDDSLWAAWGDANTTATEAAELLGFFFRRPNLAAEFPALVEVTESKYAEAVWQKMLAEQRYAGEVSRD